MAAAILAFTLFAAAVGLYTDVGNIRTRLRRSAIKSDVKLQYVRVVTQVGRDPSGRPLTAQIHVQLENPNDVDLRVEPEYMRTTFDDRTEDKLPTGFLDRDIKAGSRLAWMQGAPLRLAKHGPRDEVRGRMDWKINYGAIVEGEEPALRHELVLRGDILIAFVNGQYQSRWAPDRGIETPALEEARVKNVDSRGIWSK